MKPLLTFFTVLVISVGSLARADSATSPIAELTLYPPQVMLSHQGDTQTVLVIATHEDGRTQEVTAEAKLALSTDADKARPLAAIEEGELTALCAGHAQLQATWGGKACQVDVQVATDEAAPPASFRHDVIPILMRAGCNSGGCHGASLGKDGFRLSLFGFDPASDYHRLTREMATRRLNLAVPDESLLLLKAIGAVPHTGGKRFDDETTYYQKLRTWIDEGAKNDLAGAAKVVSVELYPPRLVFEGAEQPGKVIAVARYDDGRQRDVTSLAVFKSSNESTAALTPEGQVVSGRRGEAFLTARFDTKTVGIPVAVLEAGSQYQPITEKPANDIDELVNAKLETLRMMPGPIASDEAFLRRATIDLVGRLPSIEEREAFLADADPSKRSQLIDRLIDDSAFNNLWAMRWADLLMVRSVNNRVDEKGAYLYWQWLRERVADEQPIDEMVAELLTASGSTFTSPATNFFQVETTTQKTAENVAQAFLGVRIQCAQCHNHPFDRWTMDDYYAFTAFLAQVSRKRSEDYRETYVLDRRSGETKHPVDGRVMRPKFLGGDTPETKGSDRRQLLADWIVDPANPYFAKSIANRVWAQFFGAGIVEPVDDIRVSNPPSNGPLFERLGEKLIEFDYQLKPLVREICNSNAYQRAPPPDKQATEQTRYQAYASPRRMGAEVLLDCLVQVTGAPEKLRGLPLGESATKIANGQSGSYFLTTFGRASRQSVCACEANQSPTLSQALHLLNGSSVHEKVAKGNLVKQQLDAGKEPAEVISLIYQSCLCREPTEEEREQLTALVDADPESKQAVLEDVFWAVLNSREFIFIH